ncbi:eukaryotic aspartyl protease family protein [Wolffia australiana]
MATLTPLFLFLSLLPLFSSASASSKDISILHLHSNRSPFDTITAMAANDEARLSYLSSLAVIPVASGQQITQTANYVLRAKLGSPGQQLLLALDTSSDLSWVPCAGCAGCPAATPFTPSASSSFASADCTAIAAACAPINQTYGSASFLATISKDTLSLANDSIPGFTFACVNSVSGVNSAMPKQGLLGLGRGFNGLPAQTQAQYSGVFSYCLPSFKSYYFSGSLRLGKTGQPKSIRTTPLLKNPRRPSLYYVNLTGISVGKTAVKAAPEWLAFDPASGAGTIVDSGTVITRLVRPLYEAVRDEFRRQVGAVEWSTLGGYDTCFATPTEKESPTVVFHFEGMDLVLPAENTLIHSSATPIACLAMAASPDNVNSVLNVIANLQQQNVRVLIDTVANRVGFARELCN